MHRTPLQTLLAERLQSARGLGWAMPAAGDAYPTPSPRGSIAGTGGVPAWFRFVNPMLRRLGFSR
jgi:hypothetical protein